MFASLTTSLKLPDAWQHRAVNLLRSGNDVVVSAPTGAGKTYIFELLHESAHLKGQAVYTVPTRALANDKYAEWRSKGWQVGIATGDLSENIGAPVLVATLETQLERLINGRGPSLLVMDEYQMISDPGRGAHYEGAIALAPPETRLLLLSGSVANPDDIAAWMRHLGRPAEVVVTHERPVPLDEMPIEMLPQRMARHFDGYWPKLAAAALLGDLAPLLIFAPRRREAENIARSLANELPPGDPLSLTAEQKAVCGKELTSLLERRIAYHHSGLSYAARAGVIEPLAKAGQLRVISATMGLAAGINFSVRSVHVAATRFHDGVAERQLAPDELLQMYGRAGRRGLDEKGYLITTRQSPTLLDGRPARLHRSKQLAWPMFLRVMKHAALKSESPFDAASRFASRLFAKAPPPLGLEPDAPPTTGPSPDGKADFGLQATETQILNSAGQWEEKSAARLRTIPFDQLWIRTDTASEPAITQVRFIAGLGAGLARPFRLPDRHPTDRTQYGLELVLGQTLPGKTSAFRPTKALRKLLKLDRQNESLSLDEFRANHWPQVVLKMAPPALAKPDFPTPALEILTSRDELIIGRCDLRAVSVLAYQDQLGIHLLSPEERTIPRARSTGITTDTAAPLVEPRTGSPIHSWRTLGLIDAQGTPTRRGEIFSFFQHGEGLAIAAALEDETYPLDELIIHLANLRAGVRFEISGDCGSERLAACCRKAYGFVSHQGYLESGLPTDYGEAAAEVIGSLLQHERIISQDRTHAAVAEGDVSRVYIEWLSLIRHVVHAPAHPWSRWQHFQTACSHILTQHTATTRHLFHLDLPPLTNKQRDGRPKHYLMARA